MTGLRHFELNKILVQITKAVFKFDFAVSLLLSEILVELVKVLIEMLRGLSLIV